MEYTFVSGFSALQRATIQVFWVPQWSADPPLNKTSLASLGTNALYSATFEIRAGECYNFRVGWRSNQAFEQLAFQEPVFGDDLASNYSPSSCNGCVYVRVVNPITGATTSNASIQVYARGLPGMRPLPAVTGLVQRFLKGTATPYATPTPLSDVKIQVGIFDLDCDEQSFEVPSISDLSPEVTASESIDSVRAVMQRLSLVAFTPGDAAGNYTVAVRTPGATSVMAFTGVSAIFTGFQWHRFYGKLFSGIRGSYRYKQICGADKIVLAMADVIGNPPATVGTMSFAAGACVQCVRGGESAIEFSFPYKSEFLYRLSNTTPGIQPQGIVKIETPGGVGSAYHFYGLGPDFQVGGYVGGARVTFL